MVLDQKCIMLITMQGDVNNYVLVLSIAHYLISWNVSMKRASYCSYLHRDDTVCTIDFTHVVPCVNVKTIILQVLVLIL